MIEPQNDLNDWNCLNNLNHLVLARTSENFPVTIAWYLVRYLLR